jgi:hypothetical protein
MVSRFFKTGQAHAYNPTYPVSGDREDLSLRPVQAKKVPATPSQSIKGEHSDTYLSSQLPGKPK